MAYNFYDDESDEDWPNLDPFNQNGRQLGARPNRHDFFRREPRVEFMGGNAPFPMHARARRPPSSQGSFTEFPVDHPRSAPRQAQQGHQPMTAAAFMERHTDYLNFGRANEPPNTDCPICLETIQEHVCVQIKGMGDCKHVFGLECLQAFLGRNPGSKKECPLCRQEWIPEAGVWQHDARQGRGMMLAQQMRHPFPVQAHGHGAHRGAYMFPQGQGANMLPQGYGQHAPRVVFMEEPPRRHRHRSSRHGAQQMQGEDAYEPGELRDGPEQAALQAQWDEMMRNRPPPQQ